MKQGSGKNRRQSIRLRGYDYTGKAGYFVTLCTRRRTCLFGEITGGEMRTNALGRIVGEEWFRAANVRPGVCLYPYEFVIMPNHIHAIIWILNSARTLSARATHRVAPTPHATTATLAGTTRRVAPRPPRGTLTPP
jgi:putative transposase